MMIKKVEITDSKILKLLNSKKEISAKILAYLKQYEEIETEVHKCEAQHARIDEKVRPLIKKQTDKLHFEEFEEVSRVGQDEKDLKWYIEIADRLEEFKIHFKEQKDAGK